MRALWLLSCFFVIGAARAEVVDIDNAELARLSAAGIPLIDVRTAPEWEETGIVPGSHPITFFDSTGKANTAAWLEKAKAVARPGDPVAVICRSGARTRLVSQLLSQQAGYAKVYNVREGIRAWIREGRPVVPAAPVVAACRTAGSC